MTTTTKTDVPQASTDQEAPGPGRYIGVPDDVYHAWPHHSRSTVGLILRSPAHYYASLEAGSKPPTPLMELGTALHLRALQPGELRKRFYRGGDSKPTPPEKPEGINRRTKDGKAAYAAWVSEVLEPWEKDVLEPWEAERANMTELSPAAWEAMEMMHEAVRMEPAAALLLRAGDTEVSYVWEDPTTGLMCRCRTDLEALDRNLIGDLKSTEDARPEAFSRILASGAYYRQAAWYLDGVNAVLGAGTVTRFVFVVVERVAPYGVGVYALDDDDIDRGREENLVALKRLAWCLENDSWPGYGRKITPISLPVWKRREIDEGIDK